MKQGYNWIAFHAVNKQHHAGEVHIDSVNFKENTCVIGYNNKGDWIQAVYNIDYVVSETIKGHFSHITNPSKLKSWRGFVEEYKG